MPQHTSDQIGETPAHKEPSIISWLFDSSIKLAIITAFLFLTGWSYLIGYFGVFDLSVLTLDIPFYAAVVSAFSPLVILLVWTFTLLLPVVTAAVLLDPLRHEQHLIQLFNRLKNKRAKTVASGTDVNAASATTSKTPWWQPVVLVSSWGTSTFFIALGFLWWAQQLGQNAGYSYKQHPTKRAYLNFKADEKTESDDRLKNASCEGRLMILTQTKELVVVFAVTNDGKFVEENSIFIVPRADLSSVQIQPIQPNEKLVDKTKAKYSGACAKYEEFSQRATQPTVITPSKTIAKKHR